MARLSLKALWGLCVVCALLSACGENHTPEIDGYAEARRLAAAGKDT
ncbi:MAG: hypothetical protein HN611_28980, partial [Gemmatimonadetes bacterium]|nr:hypothetical protein [Gemmatimonadota bacterium]